MAQERLAMRDIKELLRLRFGLGLSQRQTAKAGGFGRTTVQEYETRAIKAALTDPAEIEKLSIETIYERLGFVTETRQSLMCEKRAPDWKKLHEEFLRFRHTTLSLLWSEYKEQHADGYQYSYFCELYKDWKKKLSVTMRQEHKAGEKIFIDYAGTTIDVIDSVLPATLRENRMLHVI